MRTEAHSGWSHDISCLYNVAVSRESKTAGIFKDGGSNSWRKVRLMVNIVRKAYESLFGLTVLMIQVFYFILGSNDSLFKYRGWNWHHLIYGAKRCEMYTFVHFDHLRFWRFFHTSNHFFKARLFFQEHLINGTYISWELWSGYISKVYAFKSLLSLLKLGMCWIWNLVKLVINPLFDLLQKG